MSFCDPRVTVPEVARLLRPGGLLAFAQTSPLLYLTWDERRERQDTKLHRSYFGLGRLELGDGTIDFQIPHGEWFGLFRESGFSVEDFVELRPHEDASTTYDDFAPHDWARRWPAEQIWKVRKAHVSDPAPLESALLVPVPEAEPFVQRHRFRHDSVALRGVPAHITVLFPFVAPGSDLGGHDQHRPPGAHAVLGVPVQPDTPRPLP